MTQTPLEKAARAVAERAGTPVWEEHEAIARAVLIAVRDSAPIGGRVFGPDGSESATILWQEMIDHILRDKGDAP